MAVHFGGGNVYNISFNGTPVNAAFFNNNLVFSKGISSSTLTVTSTYVVSNILISGYPYPDYWQEPIMTVLDLKNQLDQPNATLHVYDQNSIEKLDTDPACTKDSIVFAVDGITIDTKMFIQKGDLNCDGMIDIEDERIIIAHDTLEGPHITDPDILYAADINDDGDINFIDRGYVISYCARDITDEITTSTPYMESRNLFITVNTIYGRSIPANTNPVMTVAALKSLLTQNDAYLHVYDTNGNEVSGSANAATKMKIKYIVNGVVKDAKQLVIKGDVDCDGAVTMNDFSIVRDFVNDSDTIAFTEFEKREAADTNDNNNITMADAELIVAYYMQDLTQLDTNSQYVNVTDDYAIVNVVAGQGAPLPKDPPLTVLELKNLFVNDNNTLHVYDTNDVEMSNTANVATKMKISYEYSDVAIDEKTIILVGDVNNDGGIDMVDYGIINNHVSGTTPITDPVDLIAADVNEDGSITQTDANLVRNYYENS